MLIEAIQCIVIPTTNTKKSIEFYNKLLDFEIIKEEKDSVLLQFDNIQFQLLFVESLTPSNYPLFSCILDMDDFTEALQELDENEVTIVSPPAVTDSGEKVWIADPSKNIIELFYIE